MIESDDVYIVDGIISIIFEYNRFDAKWLNQLLYGKSWMDALDKKMKTRPSTRDLEVYGIVPYGYFGYMMN